jgi:hypothetical protein
MRTTKYRYYITLRGNHRIRRHSQDVVTNVPSPSFPHPPSINMAISTLFVQCGSDTRTPQHQNTVFSTNIIGYHPHIFRFHPILPNCCDTLTTGCPQETIIKKKTHKKMKHFRKGWKERKGYSDHPWDKKDDSYCPYTSWQGWAKQWFCYWNIKVQLSWIL